MKEIKEEIWKDIEGYFGLYQISNLGRVKSLGNGKTHNSKEHLLKLEKDKYKYSIVCLCKQGKMKRYKVHRLVAQHFIHNPNNLEQINHIDEDKTNNCVSNLEWCDAKHNCNYGTRNKRIGESNSKQVMCVETGVIYTSTMEIQRQLGFSSGNISNACTGRYKQAYGFHWKYVFIK